MVKSVIGSVTTYYPRREYELRMEGTSETVVKYYFTTAGRIAMRVNGVLTWLMVDQVGSTSVTSDINGGLGDTVKYSAYGEVRAGGTATDYLYTSQRNEAEIGLDFYVSRFYDPVTAHFIQADTIVPEAGSSKAYDPDSESYILMPLIVDFTENQLLEKQNRGNDVNKKDFDKNTVDVPSNPIFFDRYAYALNNPIRFSDPTGHNSRDSITSWLQWLNKNVNLIWSQAPSSIKSLLFSGPGTRIIQIDHPHGGVSNYHFNSDLKILKLLNHANVEPIVRDIYIGTQMTVQGLVATSKVITPFIEPLSSWLIPIYIPRNLFDNLPGIPKTQPA